MNRRTFVSSTIAWLATLPLVGQIVSKKPPEKNKVPTLIIGDRPWEGSLHVGPDGPIEDVYTRVTGDVLDFHVGDHVRLVSKTKADGEIRGIFSKTTTVEKGVVTATIVIRPSFSQFAQPGDKLTKCVTYKLKEPDLIVAYPDMTQGLYLDKESIDKIGRANFTPLQRTK